MQTQAIAPIALARDARTHATITLDLSRPRCIFITGKRGSGKTTTLHTIASNAANAGATVIAIDPIGALLTLVRATHPVSETRQQTPSPTTSALPTIVSIVGDASPSSSPLLLNPSDLSTDAWLALFNLSLSKPGGILLSRALRHVRRTPSPPAGGTEGGRHYLIPDLIAQIETDDRANESTKEAIANRLEAAHHDWGIFRQTRPEPGRGDGHQNLAETFIPGLHLVDLSRVPSPIFRKMEASQGQERVQKASRERELQIGD